MIMMNNATEAHKHRLPVPERQPRESEKTTATPAAPPASAPLTPASPTRAPNGGATLPADLDVRSTPLDRTAGLTKEQIDAERDRLLKKAAKGSKGGVTKKLAEAPQRPSTLTDADKKAIAALKKEGHAAGKTGASPFAMRKAGAALKSETAGKKKPGAGSSKKPAKPKTAAAAKTTATAPRKPTERAHYDWKGARDAAAKGKVPAAPDFSANTHRSYRGTLDEVEKLVKAGDLADLQAYRVKGPNSGSPGSIKRYREIAIIALKAKAAAK